MCVPSTYASDLRAVNASYEGSLQTVAMVIAQEVTKECTRCLTMQRSQEIDNLNYWHKHGYPMVSEDDEDDDDAGAHGRNMAIEESACMVRIMAFPPFTHCSHCRYFSLISQLTPLLVRRWAGCLLRSQESQSPFFKPKSGPSKLNQQIKSLTPVSVRGALVLLRVCRYHG